MGIKNKGILCFQISNELGTAKWQLNKTVYKFYAYEKFIENKVQVCYD